MIKKSTRYLFPLLLLSIITVRLFAQIPDYHVQFFGESFGIRSDMTRLQKDQYGFIWMMSSDRIYRFDGKNITNFKLADRPFSIFCDKNNRIWATAYSSIYLFKNNYEGFVRLPFDTSGIVLGRCFQLEGKPVWLHTSKGIYEWQEKQQQFKSIKFNGLNPALRFAPVYFTHYRNSFFLVANDSIYNVDILKNTTQSAFFESINGIYAVSDKLLLVTNRKSISFWYDYTTNSNIRINAKKEILGNNDDFLYIRDIQSLNDSIHLLATHSGLIEVNSRNRRLRKLTLYNKGWPLDPSPYFYDITIDQTKKIWIMHGAGLLSFSPEQESIGLIRNRETASQKIWPNNARNFAEDSKGNLWISTSRGFGYWSLHDNSITMYPAAEGASNRLNQPSVRGLKLDGNNLIMGTANGGVWIYNTVTKKYSRPDYRKWIKTDSLTKRLETDFIQHILELPNREYLIIGRNAYIMNRHYEIQMPDIPGRDEFPNYAYIDSDKTIWLCTPKGMHRFDSSLRFKQTISFGQDVVSMCEYKKGEYFAGTNRGLFFVKLKPSQSITRLLFIEQDTRISFIVNDQSGTFWIGSDEGLSRYNPATQKTERFDYSDNTQGEIYSRNSNYFNSKGLLFLGGNNGINYFHPERIPEQKDQLEIILTKVIVNQDDTSYYIRPAPMNLTYQQNSIEIEYVAPYYSNSIRLQYRYRLKGLDSSWKNNGNNNRIRFTALRPGNYSFILAASTNGIDWFESKEKLDFLITPPFWKTWWFILFIFLSATALAIWLFQRRIAVIKAKASVQQQLKGLEIRALRSQMNPHFIFNSLNAISQLVASKRNEEGLQYLSKFSKLLRLVLDESEKSFISLKDEIRILDLYLQLEALRFGSSFSYTIHSDDSLDEEEILLPSFLIHPIIENAIWHGLLHKEGDRRLMINFYKKGKGKLLCIVKDNGIGIEAASRKKQQQLNGEKQDSKGLKMVKERLALLEEQQHAPSVFLLEDLKDDNGYISGTKCTLEIPVIYE